LLLGAVAAHAQEPASLKRLDDAELRGVNGQTQPVVVRAPVRSAGFKTPLLRNLFPSLNTGSGSGDAQGLLFPLFGILTADVSARDVSFGSNPTSLRLNPDGSYTVPLPQTIGELDVQNIRINSPDSNNNSFGSVQMRGIDLNRTVITITPTR
jgi:hypothetical protein